MTSAVLFSPDINIFGLYIPWIALVTFFGFLGALVVVKRMEELNLTRFVWHLPLFLLALAVFFSSVIGLICNQ